MTTQLRMKEAELQSSVIDLAHLMRWHVAHFRPALTQSGRWVTPVAADGAGFPDLVMVRRGRLIVAELKSDDGKTRPEQVIWLDLLREVEGIETHLWKPCHWLSGEIERTLK